MKPSRHSTQACLPTARIVGVPIYEQNPLSFSFINEPTTKPSKLSKNTTESKKADNTPSSESDPCKHPWQKNRQWLGMVFIVCFLVAMGLLITSIYTA
ncbi:MULTISPECIES: hypothetical protein [unclassified Moraxella]|uniref:hypothetical protein n=1 Tax=unclassified Moraxella TaxID=2685852 RepID=UPI003AF56AA1